jgi:phosphoribosylaminoimidazolecarboxamide formyltransferase/IMP cyclohydrolase
VSRIPITRALVSVYDKAGLDYLATALHTAGVQIVSTGSTARAIEAAGVPVTAVEEVTGFPECLDGRVKTLHPAVHAGLLADMRNPAHREQLHGLAIAPFQLLVSNLYPFAQAVAAGAAPAECIEQIDIGGPAMVRAAAKNHENVAVVTNPDSYTDVASAIAAGGFTLEERRRLAARAFAHTAGYDAAVASWFAASYAPDDLAAQTGWPDVIASLWRRADVLRYGENPHQRAALYLPAEPDPAGVAEARLLHGKAMSYNNYVDADAAWRAALEFAEPCVAIVKHSNPCGIAVAADIAQAHRKAHACDPVSAYGGVIAANRPVSVELAAQIAGVFTEVIIAPGYDRAAMDMLTKKKNQRLLQCRLADGSADEARDSRPDAVGLQAQWHQIRGGLLAQSADAMAEPGDRRDGWRLVAGSPATDEVLADLEFAWRACRGVKSNAILLARDQATVGIGMGQVNRVDAARLAVDRAGDRAVGSVAASDAFFPFADGLVVLIDAGAQAIVEPGGSVRDDEVIAAAQAAGVSLYFTGVRHFWH